MNWRLVGLVVVVAGACGSLLGLGAELTEVARYRAGHVGLSAVAASGAAGFLAALAVGFPLGAICQGPLRGRSLGVAAGVSAPVLPLLGYLNSSPYRPTHWVLWLALAALGASLGVALSLVGAEVRRAWRERRGERIRQSVRTRLGRRGRVAFDELPAVGLTRAEVVRAALLAAAPGALAAAAVVAFTSAALGRSFVWELANTFSPLPVSRAHAHLMVLVSCTGVTFLALLARAAHRTAAPLRGAGERLLIVGAGFAAGVLCPAALLVVLL